MIRLDTTTRKLQAVLGGAITTNQLPITVCYSDKTATAYTGGTTVINTNNTTAVDICAAPAASTVRDIDTINVNNADTVSATVTIRYNDNGTTYTLFKATLATGDQLTYVHGVGWTVLDSTGKTKVGAGVNGPGSSTDNALVRWDGTAGTAIQNSGWTLSDTDALNGVSGSVGAPSLTLNGETTSGLYRIGANNHGYAISGAKVLDISSAGLAVIGAIDATLDVNTTRATGAAAMRLESATGTNQVNTVYVNTGGTYYNGVENSTGTGFGGTAYSLLRYAPAGRVIQDIINASPITTVSSTGLAVTGTLSATSTVTLSNTAYLKYTGSTSGAAGEVWVGPNGGGGLFLNVPTGENIVLGVNNAAVATFSASSLTVSGTGPHAVGGATDSTVQLYLRGSFTSGGTASGIYIENTLTPAVGGNAYGFVSSPTLVEAGSGTHADFASALFIPPTITGGAATLTNASTLKITGAPTGATNNYALWVDAGTIRFDGTTGAAAQTGTLTNAPSAGNPAYWMPVNANGTTYYIPCWT